MQSQYSIRILDQPGGGVVFWPWIPGAKAGDNLIANAADLVTWNNMTNKTLTLKSINPPNTFLTDPIPAGKVSDPIFKVTKSVTYACTNPTTPQHSIQIVPPPAAATS